MITRIKCVACVAFHSGSEILVEYPKNRGEGGGPGGGITNDIPPPGGSFLNNQQSSLSSGILVESKLTLSPLTPGGGVPPGTPG